MRVLYRTILYSACLVAVLVFFSVRLYHSPRQAATRLHRTFSRFTQKPVHVDGADSTPWGPLRVRSIVFPAAPPLESRSVLVLEDVTVGSSDTRDLFRRAMGSRDLDEEGAAGAVRVERAAIALDGLTETVPGGERTRWNFDDLLQAGALQSLLDDGGGHVWIDRLRFELYSIHPPLTKSLWSFEAREVEVHAAPQSAEKGVAIGGELLECKDWYRGRADLFVSLSGDLRLTAAVEDFRGLETWVGLLGSSYRSTWRWFVPRGSRDAAIHRFEVPAGRGGGPVTLEATVKYFDGALRLGEAGLDVAQVSGLVHVTGPRIELRGAGATGESTSPAQKTSGDSASPVHAEVAGVVWGLPAVLDGSMGPLDAKIEIRIPPSRVEEAVARSQAADRSIRLGARDGPGGSAARVTTAGSGGATEAHADRASPSARSRVLELLEAFRVRGLLEGALSFEEDSARPGVPAMESWKGLVKLGDATLGSLPVVERMRCEIQFERQLRGGASRWGTGDLGGGATGSSAEAPASKARVGEGAGGGEVKPPESGAPQPSPSGASPSVPPAPLPVPAPPEAASPLPPAAEATEGQGTMVVEELLLAGVGRLSGGMPFTWNDGRVRIKLDLQSAPSVDGTQGGSSDPGRPIPNTEPAGSSNPPGALQGTSIRELPPAGAPAGAPGAGPPGSLLGSAAWTLGGGDLAGAALDVDVRWLGLTLHTALLRTAELGGDLRWGAGEPSGKVTLILARPVIPSGALGEGEAEQTFESGKGLLRVDPEGVEVVSIRLLGENSCLRASGRISLDGEVDLIVLIAGPPGHLELSALPEESRPPEWRSSGGSAFRAFRISGPMGAPRTRPVGEQDPAFESAR